jgi:putative transposase
MGRERRLQLPGLTYHVTNRGNNRDIIFVEPEDYEKFLGLLYRFKLKYQFKLFSYCLMTNHIHLLIKTSQQGSISKIMQSLTVAHTRHFHYKYKRCGHVWQGRFSSPVVSDDEYLLTAMRYIEQNPLRARMVKRIEDYRWSSYRLNARIEKSKLIDRDYNPVFQSLGGSDDERVEVYTSFLAEGVKEKDLEAIRKSSREGTGYISQKFQEQINNLLPKKRKRGRPCKGKDYENK